MSDKTFPFSREKLEEIAAEIPTPFHLYDEKAIRETARSMNKAFDWVPGGFKNYFAVKACPNPSIMQLLKEEGFGSDCSSLPELEMTDRVGICGEDIMFSSNDTPAEEYQRAKDLCAIINLDDITHIDYLEQHVGIPDTICFRYNPGDRRTGNAIIGEPTEAKYGLTHEQIFEAYRIMKEKGVKKFALHTMVASNELNPDYFIETARMLFQLAADLQKEVGVRIEMINLGGGVGIPYKPEEEPVDLEYVSRGVQKLYEEIIKPAGLDPMRIVMECGRVITGPHGYLISRVRHLSQKYKSYAGLDASMANLMRPAVYGAYHHISVPGKEDQPHDHVYDVTGSLCENNDKFAVDRSLPKLEEGDLVALHEAGAHGYAMGFNYNGKLRSAEVLLQDDGSFRLIRRAETIDDYFATLRFPGASVPL
ncbi:MAG: diaminopimelate decarboxylase [Spirochaetaceae bacterium]|nr:diaminopimelate decarboxylase [Spirochaetaceae bacterium]MCF7948283.1 diaminopimelate decarboxylase [Spirochaetia bacterium]MCF7952273.1 diaminopimelate decarboxylase [Spirochaetaceae bacterium]